MIIVIKVDIGMFLEWENSGKFQNNAINDVKKISLSHVTIIVMFMYIELITTFQISCNA